MDISKEILSKIQKLKALSEGAAKINSLAESEAAAIAMNRLLTKYNLSLLDIEDNQDGKTCVEIIESQSISVQNPYGRLWKERLIMTLCHYNYCKMLVSSYKVFLLGTELNTMTVIDLFNTLSSVYLHTGKMRYEDAKKWFKGAQLTQKYKRKYLTSYLLGCSIGLSVKLEEIQSNECVAIAVCHKDKIEKYMNDNLNIKTKSSSLPKIIESAYSKGFIDGKNQPLQKTFN